MKVATKITPSIREISPSKKSSTGRVTAFKKDNRIFLMIAASRCTLPVSSTTTPITNVKSVRTKNYTPDLGRRASTAAKTLDG